MSKIGLYPALLKAFKQISFFLDLTEIILSKHESFCFIIDESCETNDFLNETDKISLCVDKKNYVFNMYYQYSIFTELNTVTNFFAPYNYEYFINSHINENYYDNLILENIINCFAGVDKNPAEVLMLMGNIFGTSKKEKNNDELRLNLFTTIIIKNLANIFTNDKISENDQDLNSLIKISQFLKKCAEFIPQINNERIVAKEQKSSYDIIDQQYNNKISEEVNSIKKIRIGRDKILQYLRSNNINWADMSKLFLKYFNNATLIIASDIADYIRSGVLPIRPKVFYMYKNLELIASCDNTKLNNPIAKRFASLIQKYRPTSKQGGSANVINAFYNEYLILVVIVVLFLIIWIQQSRDYILNKAVIDVRHVCDTTYMNQNKEGCRYYNC